MLETSVYAFGATETYVIHFGRGEMEKAIRSGLKFGLGVERPTTHRFSAGVRISSELARGPFSHIAGHVKNSERTHSARVTADSPQFARLNRRRRGAGK